MQLIYLLNTCTYSIYELHKKLRIFSILIFCVVYIYSYQRQCMLYTGKICYILLIQKIAIGFIDSTCYYLKLSNVSVIHNPAGKDRSLHYTFTRFYTQVSFWKKSMPSEGPALPVTPLSRTKFWSNTDDWSPSSSLPWYSISATGPLPSPTTPGQYSRINGRCPLPW